MFRALQWGAAAFLIASGAVGQDIKGELQTIPYELLQQQATTKIDFESFTDWPATLAPLNQDLSLNGASFASLFQGQAINGQVTGYTVDTPLALLPPSTYTQREIDRYLRGNRNDIFHWRKRNGAPIVAMWIGGFGRNAAANLLSGLTLDDANHVLTSYSPRLLNLNPSPRHEWIDDNWQDTSVAGIEPLALYFDDDQTAIGFTLVYLNRQAQTAMLQNSSETGVAIKFFDRDGAMISQISFLLSETQNVAFARCGGAHDIAGVQITNSSVGGFAIDDIIFGLPIPEPWAPLTPEPLFRPSEDVIWDNPLQVDLCSYYTS